MQEKNTVQSGRPKAVCISCFNEYTTRMRLVREVIEERGFDCVYITSDFSHGHKAYEQVSIPKSIVIHAKPYQKNLSVQRLRSHYCFAKEAFKAVRKIDPELVFVMIPPNSLAYQAKKYKKKHPNTKIILDLYDLWPETFPNSKAKQLLKIPFSLWGNLRNRGLYAADLITTECMLYQSVLAKYLEGKKARFLPVCRPAVTATGEYHLSENELSICYLGSINNIIDIPTIAKTLGELTQYKKVTLHIIGDGESRQTLIDAVQARGVSVEFHGKIFDSQAKQAIFDRCHFGINIMKSSVCVGLTLKSLDYFAGGLPILNTIRGDTEAIVKQYHIGYQICEESLAETAKQIADLPMTEFVQMREQTVRCFCENFSEDQFLLRVQNILEDV